MSFGVAFARSGAGVLMKLRVARSVIFSEGREEREEQGKSGEREIGLTKLGKKLEVSPRRKERGEKRRNQEKGEVAVKKNTGEIKRVRENWFPKTTESGAECDLDALIKKAGSGGTSAQKPDRPGSIPWYGRNVHKRNKSSGVMSPEWVDVVVQSFWLALREVFGPSSITANVEVKIL